MVTDLCPNTDPCAGRSNPFVESFHGRLRDEFMNEKDHAPPTKLLRLTRPVVRNHASHSMISSTPSRPRRPRRARTSILRGNRRDVN